MPINLFVFVSRPRNDRTESRIVAITQAFQEQVLQGLGTQGIRVDELRIMRVFSDEDEIGLKFKATFNLGPKSKSRKILHAAGLAYANAIIGELDQSFPISFQYVQL